MTFCCELGLVQRLVHISIGSVCLLAVGVVITVAEQRMFSFLIDRLPNKIQKIANKILMIKQLKND